MMAGKFIAKMFDATTKQLEIEKSDIELLCEMSYKNIISTIEEYFQNNMKDSKYIFSGQGKVSILLKIKFTLEFNYQKEKLEIFIQIYKLSEKKFIISISLKNVNL